jgi:hypothetical protein
VTKCADGNGVLVIANSLVPTKRKYVHWRD